MSFLKKEGQYWVNLTFFFNRIEIKQGIIG